MKKLHKWSKNRFFLAMLLAISLILVLYFYSAYQTAKSEVNTLKSTPTPEATSTMPLGY